MPKISIRTLLLAMIALAIPLALYRAMNMERSGPGLEPFVAVLGIYGTLFTWIVAGASFGKDNGRTMTGAIFGLVLYTVWAFNTLLPAVE